MSPEWSWTRASPASSSGVTPSGGVCARSAWSGNTRSPRRSSGTQWPAFVNTRLRVLEIVDAVDERREHAVVAELRDLLVDAAEQARRRARDRGARPQLARQARHVERGADRLAGDVADGEPEVRRVVPDEVVEVAADLIRGLVVHREVEADDLRHVRGQQAALDLPRDAKIALELLAA